VTLYGGTGNEPSNTTCYQDALQAAIVTNPKYTPPGSRSLDALSPSVSSSKNTGAFTLAPTTAKSSKKSSTTLVVVIVVILVVAVVIIAAVVVQKKRTGHAATTNSAASGIDL